MYTCKYVTHPLHWNVGEISDCNFNLGEISNGTTPKIRKSQGHRTAKHFINYVFFQGFGKKTKRNFFNIKNKNKKINLMESIKGI
jgi:hypothetical protein